MTTLHIKERFLELVARENVSPYTAYIIAVMEAAEQTWSFTVEDVIEYIAESDDESDDS